jgi:hypothetical protein
MTRTACVGAEAAIAVNGTMNSSAAKASRLIRSITSFWSGLK